MHKQKKEYLYLHCLLFIYSLGGVCSKTAGGKKFLSAGFMVCYGTLLAILIFYAVMWQQLLKKLPLITAYANKSATIIWGMLFGKILFQENITFQNILGAGTIITGILFMVSADENEISK